MISADKVTREVKAPACRWATLGKEVFVWLQDKHVTRGMRDIAPNMAENEQNQDVALQLHLTRGTPGKYIKMSL